MTNDNVTVLPTSSAPSIVDIKKALKLLEEWTGKAEVTNLTIVGLSKGESFMFQSGPIQANDHFTILGMLDYAKNEVLCDLYAAELAEDISDD